MCHERALEFKWLPFCVAMLTAFFSNGQALDGKGMSENESSAREILFCLKALGFVRTAQQSLGRLQSLALFSKGIFERRESLLL